MDLHQVLLTMLREAIAPLSLHQIRLKLNSPLSLDEARSAVEELISLGQVKPFIGAGSRLLYAVDTPLALATRALERTLEKAKVAPRKEALLHSGVPRELRPWVAEALDVLIAEKRAFLMVHGAKAIRVHRKFPRPSDMLDRAERGMLQRVLNHVNRFRQSPLSLDDMLAFVDGETSQAAEKRAPTAEQLLTWYAADAGRSSSTRMVTISQTYQRYQEWAGDGADRESFKSVLAALYEEGRVQLEPADRPGELTAEERELLIPLTFGPPGCTWAPL
jgi:hypothetical protein